MAYLLKITDNNGNTYNRSIPVFESDSEAENHIKNIMREWFNASPMVSGNTNARVYWNYSGRTPIILYPSFYDGLFSAIPTGVSVALFAGTTYNSGWLWNGGINNSIFDFLQEGVTYTIGNTTFTPTVITPVTNTAHPIFALSNGAFPNVTYDPILKITTDNYRNGRFVNDTIEGAHLLMSLVYYNSATQYVNFLNLQFEGNRIAPVDDLIYLYRESTLNIFVGELTPQVPIISPDDENTNYIDSETGEGDDDNDENNGGEGTFDYDDINITINDNFDYNNTGSGLLGTGLISLKYIDKTNLNSLGRFLYSDDMVNALKNFFAGDVNKAIIDLYQLPVEIPHETNTSNVYFGNVDSGVNGYTVTRPKYTLDMGVCSVTKYDSASFMNFAPYSTFYIFLPFIGVRQIETNFIRSVNDNGASLHLYYNIDALTGDCLAQLTLSKRNNVTITAKGNITTKKEKNNIIVKEFAGNLKRTLPRGGSDTITNALQGIAQIAGGIGKISTGNIVNGLTDSVSSISNIIGNQFESTGVSSAVGYLGTRYPYLICVTPASYVRGKLFGQFDGYTCNKWTKIKNAGKFVKVKNVMASGFGGTAHEQEKVVELLKGGVWCE